MDASSHDTLNPYAPSRLLEENDLPVSKDTTAFPRQTSIEKLVVRWTIVCGIAAAPSFFIGSDVSQNQHAAMLLGILCFIILYVLVDRYSSVWPWRQRLVIRRIIVFCYATRIVISILFPIGMSIDILAGMISISIVDKAVLPEGFPQQRGPMTFAGTFVLTLVQGTVLNLILAAWGLLSFIVIWLFAVFYNRHVPSSNGTH